MFNKFALHALAAGMGATLSSPPPPKQHVLVVGATGRTGRRIVQRLAADPGIEVSALARDADRAQLVLGDDDGSVDVILGDLHDVDAWAPRLEGVSAVVAAVSCGASTDPWVALGVRPAPPDLPHTTDYEGIAKLAAAAEAHGVRRFVAVSTAAAGAPWSPGALFLNLTRHGAAKCKWLGEQAVRSTGLDYVVIRPHGLGPDAPQPAVAAPAAPARGIEFAQPGERTPTARTKPARMPRDELARLCHEAVAAPPGVASRATVDVWPTAAHSRPMPWGGLRSDPPGRLAELDHDMPMAVGLGGAALAAAAVARATWRFSGWLIMARLRRGW